MRVVAVKVSRGPARDVRALKIDGKSPVIELLEHLARSDGAALARLVRLFDATAELGPLRNGEKYHDLGDGISEFKSRDGWRVACFSDGKELIILTHTFQKPHKKLYKKEKEKAQSLRLRYFHAKATGQLVFENGD